MSILRIVNLVVLILGIAGGLYYTVSDNHLQGIIVVLMGILWFVSVPHIIGDE
ncbi:MAG: hypothetical protein O2821_02560 [Chloroflexi bacterium]|nr:hypothetical protein [Chloroflexota bacterium]MDA1227262.1 hypothetical protein [Chloroflexota bacterium]